ncbi:MAG TPA: glycosyltransferase family 87 protein [Ktedonobacteraceae bacterium]
MAQLKRSRWLLLCALLALIFCEVAWLAFFTFGEGDIVHYECYGLIFWLGSHGTTLLPQAYCSFLSHLTPQPPLRMLPLEYPPLTVLLFSLPLLTPLSDYTLVFALLMTLSAALIYWLLARSTARRAAPIFLLYLLLGTAGVFQERFDLLPAACVLLCLLAAERGHWRYAYLALSLGILLKLYPLVMLPTLFLAEQRTWLSSLEIPAAQSSWPDRVRACIVNWHWRNLLLCLALLFAVTSGFALLNLQDAILSPLIYFLQRPAQIESLIASFIWLGGHFGVPYETSFTFGSLNINSSLLRLISPTDTLLTGVGLLAIYWLQLRKRIDLAQTLVGLVCILIVTNKVFSPQYLIWLMPLLAYIAARGQTSRLWLAAWAVISLLTSFIYVFYYSRMPDPQTARLVVLTLPGFFEFVALRNLLLAVTVLSYLCGWWGARAGATRPTNVCS